MDVMGSEHPTKNGTVAIALASSMPKLFAAVYSEAGTSAGAPINSRFFGVMS